MMKYLGAFILIACLSIGCFNGNSGEKRVKLKKTNSSASKDGVISAAQFKSKIAELSNEQLVDVRTSEEYTAGHISGATNIDFYEDNFQPEMLKQLDKEKPVLLYCARGGRSGKAYKMLKNNGFKEVYDLDGGYNDWPK